ncbi:MAG: uroporphyrinogen decarboxylase family protein [Anaerolineae bacterium]|nr:uroporphyrinogen decarboxylase family protein [Anaerolineae bacterium]
MHAELPAARDVVRRAVERRGPAWTPYSIDITPDDFRARWGDAAAERLKEDLRALGVCEHDGYFSAQPIIVYALPTPSPFRQHEGPGGDRIPPPFRPLAHDEWVDEWGVIWTDPAVPRVSGHPLEVGWELLAGYRFPDPCAAGRYDPARQALAEHPGRYRLGLVWFTLFERLWFLRGFNNMLMDPYLYPGEFADLADRVDEFNLASIEAQADLGVDGIFFSDDWGSQLGLLMNPEDWRKWYKPRYRRLFDAVHRRGCHVWMHLCGNVTAIVGDLIDVGLDVLNPVQPQAMSVDALAREFGGKLCFFGGADVQGTLPHGTPDEVRREVQHLIDVFGRYNGGYIGSTSHGILPDTPPANVLALFQAFHDLCGLASGI